MNINTYEVLCSYAGTRLFRPHPWPVPAGRPFPLDFTSAVYVVIGGDGRCCYVGSVCRTSGGLSDRIAEHLNDPTKYLKWHSIWVLPIRSDTPLSEVRRIEGVVGAHLGPYGSHRLPPPRPRDENAQSRQISTALVGQ